MEGVTHVLAHRTEPGLFVKLTVSKKGRLQWEFTESFPEASTFESLRKAEEGLRDHRCPNTCAIRDYGRAHSEYLSTHNPHPNLLAR